MSGLTGELPILLVAVPLLTAALLAAVGVWVPRVAADVVALVIALANLVGAGWLCARVGGRDQASWMGDWLPHHGHSVGIALVADRASAGFATLTAALTVAAVVYSWRYLEEVAATYQVLLLVFLAAMTGFVFAGDLFNVFVWFELMGVAAYALTGLRAEEPRSVHGALTFGVINTIGASCALVGVALLYARTGELNLAAVGEQLHKAPAPADALVLVACALLLAGFLVKAAAVPFHFWLADAHAVAPSPVSVLLSGAMVPLGVYAVARIWWVVFDGVIAESTIRHTLLIVGSVTAVVGGLTCIGQRHVKRLLAYSTVGHVGLFLIGLSLLDEEGTSATGLYVLGHSCTKGALFLGTGVLLHRFKTIDEHVLFGRGRLMPLTAAIFVVGGLSLSGLPPLGTWLGKSELEHAATVAGHTWVLPIVLLTSMLTGGAVLRVALRVFAGVGPRPADADELDREHEEATETEQPLSRAPLSMVVPALALLLGAFVANVVPVVHEGAATAAASFIDHEAYTTSVLTPGHPVAPAVGTPSDAWTVSSIALGLLTSLLAVGVACLSVWGPLLPAAVRRGAHAFRPAVRVLHVIHAGHMGDYVAWLVLGVAALGLAMVW